MNDRITELEIRLTHLEAALDELTDTSLRQQRALGIIAGQLDEIRNSLNELSPAAVRDLLNDSAPPHY